MDCTTCGSALPDSAAFCGQCGTQLDEADASSRTPAEQPLPADAFPTPTPPSSLRTTDLEAVRCPAPGTCVATGWYTDTNGRVQGVIDTLSDGTWTAARVRLPADAAASSSLGTGFESAACPSPSACFLIGVYKAADGSTESLIETGTPKSG